MSTPPQTRAFVEKERRLSSRVSIDATSIVTSTRLAARFCSGSSSVPCTPANRPLTVANIMCLTANSTELWDGSIAQVVVVVVVVVVV